MPKTKLKKKESGKGTKKKKVRTAYNFFYRHQRMLILKNLSNQSSFPEDPDAQAHEPLQIIGSIDDFGPDVLSELLERSPEKQRRRHRKSHGLIGFKELTKIVAHRWNQTPIEVKDVYKQLTSLDHEKMSNNGQVGRKKPKGVSFSPENPVKEEDNKIGTNMCNVDFPLQFNGARDVNPVFIEPTPIRDMVYNQRFNHSTKQIREQPPQRYVSAKTCLLDLPRATRPSDAKELRDFASEPMRNKQAESIPITQPMHSSVEIELDEFTPRPIEEMIEEKLELVSEYRPVKGVYDFNSLVENMLLDSTEV